MWTRSTKLYAQLQNTISKHDRDLDIWLYNEKNKIKIKKREERKKDNRESSLVLKIKMAVSSTNNLIPILKLNPVPDKVATLIGG